MLAAGLINKKKQQPICYCEWFFIVLLSILKVKSLESRTAKFNRLRERSNYQIAVYDFALNSNVKCHRQRQENSRN